ncbi:YtzH-like family protein [Pseudalkalibacillus hwajinpoensis]|uniref:YtzH-like family protein n=1 Tax=Guptibacillus hwajinpoensis TaxID=208199 RepID=UPI00325BD34B
MPLSHQDQLYIMADILNNHHIDCTGTLSECQQIQRLASALQQNADVAPEIKEVLRQIEEYSTAGAHETDLLIHIETHRPNLSQWVDTINHYQ